MFRSGYQFYSIRIENSHRIQDKQVDFEVMTQRNEKTKLELEHYKKMKLMNGYALSLIG